MSDSFKSRDELLREVVALRARVAELEQEARRRRELEKALAESEAAQGDLVHQYQQLESDVAERTVALSQANQALQKDIAERKRIEAELRTSQERFRALIDATGEDVVVLLNSEHRAIIVNERAARGFGLSVSDVLGQTIFDLVPADIARARHAMAAKVLVEGKATRFEDQRAGNWFDNNMCPVLGSDGRPEGVAIFARDITRRKAMEHALAEAKEQAEKANRAKSRFLAAANHDLRQPLQAMSLLLGALGYAPLGGQAREIADDMKATLSVMEGLLNALLDISKLDAGIVTPRAREFSAMIFLHQLQGQFRALAADRGVRVRLFPRKEMLRTDPDLLERILYNLVSNAVRHTRNGAVLLGARRRGDYLRIEVWDTGNGIAKDQIEHIFEEFYQLGNPARNRHQGLGLGLAIAKRIADLLGLRFGAVSKIGKGSVFYIEVPLADAAAAEVVGSSTAEVFPPLPGLTVLLVEDDEQVLLGMTRLLRVWGFRPICAATAADALALLQERELRPDAAIVAYRLPGGKNGIDLLEEIRARLGLELPAVLLTGDTASEPLCEAKASGYPLLHKPVAPGELRRAILDHCVGGLPHALAPDTAST